MLPTDTFLQRFYRIMMIQFLWGVRITMVLVWFVCLYWVTIGHEYIVVTMEVPRPDDRMPLILVLFVLIGAPLFLWQTRDSKF